MKRALGFAAGSILAVSAVSAASCASEQNHESASTVSVSTVISETTLPAGIRLSPTYEVACGLGDDHIIDTVLEGHGGEQGTVTGDATLKEIAQLACQTFELEYPEVKEPVNVLASLACKSGGVDPCVFGFANSISVELLTPNA